MQRITCPERDDWQQTAEACGFDFHTIDGERYWDERAYYAFTLDEIEQEIEAPTGEIDAMCLELVGRAVDDDEILQRLKIPETFWDLIAESWHRDDKSLYGRLDLNFSGHGPAKLLEYNADTPTSIFEAAVFQWTWLEQAIERHIIPSGSDQYNSIHERLIDAWKTLASGRHLHLAGTSANEEDAGTLTYLEDTATQAGLSTTLIDIEDIGWRDVDGFVDLDNRNIALAFKLYPWEWMFHDAFGAKLALAQTRWIEPPWKAVLSNKGILPLLWEMYPGHPNLLPAYFEDDERVKELGLSYVRKPLYSREGANVTIISGSVPSPRKTAPMAAKALSARPWRPCKNSTGNIRSSEAGSSIMCHVGCRSARTRGRSRATIRDFCRMRLCDGPQLLASPVREGKRQNVPRRMSGRNPPQYYGSPTPRLKPFAFESLRSELRLVSKNRPFS